jgi:hypothetical protein
MYTVMVTMGIQRETTDNNLNGTMYEMQAWRALGRFPHRLVWCCCLTCYGKDDTENLNRLLDEAVH